MQFNSVIFRTQRFVLAVLVAWLTILPTWASDKKGVGLSDLHATERLAALNVAWYYTWRAKPVEGAPADKFVPMIWGAKHFDERLDEIRKQGKRPVVLAFNEPNMVGQANMSVDEAIRLWPQLEPLADRIGSPAPAGVLGPWFDRFYRVARQRGLKLDFMTVHLYGPPDSQKFLAKIDETYKKYGLPIWITEFAVADWEAKDRPGTNRYSEDEVLAFMKAVLPELEKRPYVERYAWFGAGKVALTREQIKTSRLFEADGSLTPLGRFYAQFQ